MNDQSRFWPPVKLPGIGMPGCATRLGKVVGLAVHVLTVVKIEPHALEVRVHDEVDDARDRVGAVRGGRAAGQHVDALDHGRRDLVDVGAGRRSRAAARLHAAAVDQHQRAVRTQAAQADRRGAVRADRLAGTLLGDDLRQAVQQVFNAHQAGLCDVGRADGRNRRDRDLVRRGLNARARNDDLFKLLVGAVEVAAVCDSAAVLATAAAP